MRRSGFFAAFVCGCVTLAIGACIINFAFKTVEKVNEKQSERFNTMMEIME